MSISKKELRKLYRDKRASFTEDQRHTESRSVCQRLMETELYQRAEAVFCYVSYGSEFETALLIQSAVSEGKIVAVPKIIGNEMIFCKVSADSKYQLNQYGIAEPVESEELCPERYTSVLLVMPGLCFDSGNGRIGYGGGYYDRYVNKHRQTADIVIVAPALSCQYYDSAIPMEPHDIRPDFVMFPQCNQQITDSDED